MSYTPRIIINYDQLLEKSQDIEISIYDSSIDEDTLTAYGELNDALKWAKESGYIIEFKDHKLRLVIVSPELTSRNTDVRVLLDELDIEFQLDN